MTLSTFTPTNAPFYDTETISALVCDQLRLVREAETAGEITAAQAIERAQCVHQTAMDLRADAGLVERCAHCGDPIEGEPWRNSRPWPQDPYCCSACAMADNEQPQCTKGPHSYGYIPPMAGHRSEAAS